MGKLGMGVFKVGAVTTRDLNRWLGVSQSISFFFDTLPFKYLLTKSLPRLITTLISVVENCCILLFLAVCVHCKQIML